MILPISTAASLYWLGRYVVRINQWIQLYPFTDDAQALHHAYAFGLETTNAASINAYLYAADHQCYISDMLEQLKHNTQTSRGVLSNATFTALHGCSMVSALDTTNILDTCNQALEKEHPVVYQFYVLGTQVEMIDIQLRLQEFDPTILLSLYTTLTQLPPNWAASIAQLKSCTKLYYEPFYKWCDHIHGAFRGQQ